MIHGRKLAMSHSKSGVREMLSDLEPEGIRPISATELASMVEAGILRSGEPVELLRGVLVTMTPPNPPHAECVDRLTEALVPLLVGRARVRIQGPFAASEHSVPEPDVGVYPAGDYGRAHPNQALLLIEVSDSSLRKDRRVKGGIYAESGVPEYWIVNLQDRLVEVLREPVDGVYTHSETAGPGDALSPSAFPDLELRVDAILP